MPGARPAPPLPGPALVVVPGLVGVVAVVVGAVWVGVVAVGVVWVVVVLVVVAVRCVSAKVYASCALWPWMVVVGSVPLTVVSVWSGSWVEICR